MRKQLITLIVVVASATVVSTMARAAGETKSQEPFTRLIVQAQTESRGEAKNESPFVRSSSSVTRPVRHLAGQEQAIPRGEAKNELPFTATVVTVTVPDVFERYASAHPYGRGIITKRSNAEGDVLSRYLFSRWAIRMS